MKLRDEDKSRLEEYISKIKDDKNILGVILFGSALNRDDYKDIDILLISSNKLSSSVKSKYILSSPDKFEIHFLDDLPIYIAKEAIKGEILLQKDYLLICDIFINIIHEWEDFRPAYELYLDVVLNGT